jgi:hypothetical protein
LILHDKKEGKVKDVVEIGKSIGAKFKGDKVDMFILF